MVLCCSSAGHCHSHSRRPRVVHAIGDVCAVDPDPLLRPDHRGNSLVDLAAQMGEAAVAASISGGGQGGIGMKSRCTAFLGSWGVVEALELGQLVRIGNSTSHRWTK